MKDIKKALENKTEVDPALLLPKKFHDLLPLFSKQESDKLPPHRDYDYKIKLLPRASPPRGKLYGMSREEL